MRGLHALLLVFVTLVVLASVTATGGRPRACLKCGYASRCRNGGECFCDTPQVGNASFACNYDRRNLICEVYSDPTIKMVNTQNSSVTLPATFNLIKTANVIDRKSVCNVSIVGYSAQINGKYFVEGLQVYVSIVSRGKLYLATVRVIAKVENGIYKYIVLVKKGDVWEETEVTQNRPRFGINITRNCQISFLLYMNHFLLGYVWCCRIQFGIRPFNPLMKTTIPGVFVQVNKHRLLTIGEGLPDYICGNLTSKIDFEELVNEYGFRSKNQLVTLFTLQRGEILQYPGAYPGLQALQSKLLSCKEDRLKKLVRKAEFFHNYPEMISCVSEHEHVLGLYYNASLGYCDLNKEACESSQAKIKAYCSNYVLNKRKQLRAFLRDGCV